MGTAWVASGQIELANNGTPALGATAEFFAGGTTTPIDVYTTIAQSATHPYPVVADGNGRWPLVVIPYRATYDVKVSTSGGTELYYYRELPNAEPYVAAAVAPDENLSTGDIIFSPMTGTRTGFVRVNGRTIGSGSSGASERANADCETLFLYNWNNFSNAICAVSTGRGGSAAADWAANKTIALLDGRGATLRGVDDMGNTAASSLTLATFTTGNATTGGSVAGANTHQLTTAQLAAHTHTGTTGGVSATHTHSGTTSGQSAGHTHTYTGTTSGQSQTHTHSYNATATTGTFAAGAGTAQVTDSSIQTGNASVDHTHTYSGTTASGSADHTHTVTTGAESADHTHTFTSASTGSDTAHNNVSKSILGNWLQKL